MKRVLRLIVVIFLFSSVLAAADKRFTIVIQGNYFSVTDSAFKQKYGTRKIFPEGKLNVFFSGNFYAWGSYGFFPARYNWTEWSNKGVINADVAGESKLDKRIISTGVGFFAGYVEKKQIGIKLELGLCNVTHSINSTYTRIDTNAFIRSKKEKQSGIGYRGNFGVTYGLLNGFFSELSLSYIHATDTVDSTKIKLGGLQLSIGLGLKF